ncbi:Ger(x)C family spore germination protein [Cohnella sp. JJ-181]|uniref:Ger(x)C family spore germination protein n=1 Tax=Cohnella rhizoplanae TaxID=2974897 RepID=UPI0022FF9F0D|nr:Ger(x)C family spore germination protein [Cohnella sp. JJ-181]CAI6085929.1 hypothetical protein COHCIP112018_04841 [Cohnella sp. JJ-181]
MRGRRNTVRRVAALGLLTLAAGGCGSSQIVDRIALVQTAGYDRAEGHIVTSLQVGEYTDKDKTKIKLLESDSTNSFDMMPQLNLETNKPIEYGQMKMMLFGRSYAEHGIGDVLKILSRDVKVQSRCLLAVSETTALEAMRATSNTDDTLFLMNMIWQNTKTANLKGQNLQQILYGYHGTGSDIFLPYITINKQHRAQLGGVALFKDDRVVAVAREAEVLYLKLLSERSREGSLLVKLRASGGSQPYLLLRVLSSHPKFKLVSAGPVPSIRIRVAMTVMIKSISETVKIENEAEAKRLERVIKRYVETGMSDFIAKCQGLRVDPIGFGDFVRTHRRGWDSVAFYEAYPSMKTEVRVSVKLLQSGIID